MLEYVCPGCRAYDMAYECWHDENMWKLAEALSLGLPSGPATWGDPIERAWQFIDDAEGLAGSVGAPPYAVSMFHVGGVPTAATTIGLVNGRYLFIVDEEAQLIGDVWDDEGRAQLVMPELPADVEIRRHDHAVTE
ncbi:hypothetical protein [Microbacterium sp. 2RAF4]|uniref:hypothetical protein n=1 Tax=Microbacterium sp. 2RAF4 TaxID=3232999 RepID=UPI003F992D81